MTGNSKKNQAKLDADPAVIMDMDGTEPAWCDGLLLADATVPPIPGQGGWSRIWTIFPSSTISDGLFILPWPHEIQPKEFYQGKETGCPITLQWKSMKSTRMSGKIAEENAVIRITGRRKKIADRMKFLWWWILKNITGEWQKKPWAPGSNYTADENKKPVTSLSCGEWNTWSAKERSWQQATWIKTWKDFDAEAGRSRRDGVWQGGSSRANVLHVATGCLLSFVSNAIRYYCPGIIINIIFIKLR